MHMKYEPTSKSPCYKKHKQNSKSQLQKSSKDVLLFITLFVYLYKVEYI